MSISISKIDYDNKIQKLISDYGIAQSAYISNLDKNDIIKSDAFLKQMTDINSKMSIFSNTYAEKIQSDVLKSPPTSYLTDGNTLAEFAQYSNDIKNMNEKNTELDGINESLLLQRNMYSVYSVLYLIVVAIILLLIFIKINPQTADRLELFILFLLIVILFYIYRNVFYNIKNRIVSFITKIIVWIKRSLYSNNY
jgi:hypothetical protein